MFTSPATRLNARHIKPTASLGGGTPGGSNTQIQFNNSGVFGGDAALTWNFTSDMLTVGNSSTTTIPLYVRSTNQTSQIVAMSGDANKWSQIECWNDQNSAVRSATFGYSGSTSGAAVTGGPGGEQGFQGTPGAFPFVLYANNTFTALIAPNTNFGIGNTAPTSKLFVTSTNTTVTPLTVKGVASATANLFEVGNSGSTVFAVNSIGVMVGNGAGLTSIPYAGITVLANNGIVANATGVYANIGSGLSFVSGAIAMMGSAYYFGNI
jgi:hypothetical protein